MTVTARATLRLCMRGLSVLLAHAWLALPTASAQSQAITVSAAASLHQALQSVNGAYEKLNHERVSVVYGPSFRLASDIARGAVPDVFISADPASVAYLEEKKLVRGDVLVTLVRNRLVLVTRDTRAGASVALRDIASLALPDPRQHPAGKFAQAALTKLGLWERLGPKARMTASTRAALDMVSSGEVEGAIVYRSEALQDTQVRVVQLLPDSSHPPVVYTVAVTNGGRGWPVVSAYVSFLRSQSALDIFERFGFERNAKK